MQLAFVISYICRFGMENPYTDKDYRILAAAFLFIDFFVEIVSDSFKNVLKRGYFDELTATCKHVIFVELVATFYLFTTQMGNIYSRTSYYIMVPLYIGISYAARLIWKKFIQKRGVNSAKKSLLIIALEEILRETLQTVSQNRLGYSKMVAASLDSDLKGENIYGIPVVADRKDVIEFSCGEWIDEVFIPPCDEKEYPDKLWFSSGRTPAGGKNRCLHSNHHKHELCRLIQTACKTPHGYCRRPGRLPDHSADHDHLRTNDLHQLPGSDLLRTRANRSKWQKIQDVQIPKHVHGRRRTKK